MTWAVAEGALFAAFILLMYFLSYLPTSKMQLAVREIASEKARRQAIDAQLDGVAETVVFRSPGAAEPTAVLASLDSRARTATVAYGREKAVFDLNRDRDVQTLLPILLLSK